MSPSRLQDWASCGFRYLLAHVLHLGDRDEPEQVIELSATDRGSAVHEVLELFVREAIAAGAPAPNEAWSAAQRERFATIARAVLDALEEKGRTGRPLNWRLTRHDLMVLLDEVLTADDAHRRTEGARPVGVEFRFGLDDARAVTLTLDDGRTLSFRGLVDRIDRTDDGRLLVSDYKTGRGSAYQDIATGDPVKGGTLLQLGVYAEAALAAFADDPHAAVEAHYWVLDPAARYERRGYQWTTERRERFLEVVTAIADGMEAGMFPAVPGEWNMFRQTHESCTYCAFDRVCPRARGEQVAAKVGAVGWRSRDPLMWDAQV